MAYFKFTDIAISAIASAVPSGSGNSPRKAQPLQTTSDLGFEAAKRLLDKHRVDLQEIGTVLFVSKTPDYRSPATAIVLQGRLQLSKDCLAFDINIGATGFSYGLQAGCSILGSLNKKYALLIIGDTISKQWMQGDPLAMEYGDGASALLLEKKPGARPIYVENKSNGEGFKSFMIPSGGFRYDSGKDITEKNTDPSFAPNFIQADQAEMARYAAAEIPASLIEFLVKRNADVKEYDFLAFPASDKNLLQLLSGRLGISMEDLPADAGNYGNTCGNSIPLLLADTFGSISSKEIHVLSCGFGEGFSWGFADFYLDTENIEHPIETDAFFTEGFVTHDMPT